LSPETCSFTAERVDLAYQTPEEWGRQAIQHPIALLNDQAYLERKAASNALDLLNRWPEPNRPENWTSTLSSIARDEALHLHQVLRLLQERGGKLERAHRSNYASDLRALVRKGKGPLEIVDRLLVSALIEARSCERFGLLARAGSDKQLTAFYEGLWVCEQGHYKTFLQLAEHVIDAAEVKIRWQEMRDKEAFIIQNQPAVPSLHSRGCIAAGR
jgi:tRNA-(ms[2]io[6]A)-hydroxylase